MLLNILPLSISIVVLLGERVYSDDYVPSSREVSFITDICHSYIYYNNSDKELFFSDSLGISELPLISVPMTGQDLGNQIINLTEHYYGNDINPDELHQLLITYKIDTLLRPVLDGNVYGIELAGNRYLKFSNLGSPKALRYEYAVMEKRRE